MHIAVEFERDKDTGWWFATSPHIKGFLATARSLPACMVAAANAYNELEQFKQQQHSLQP